MAQEYARQLQTAKDRLMTIIHAIELRDLARHDGAPISWNHVGDLGHVNVLLSHLCAFLGTDAAEDPE